MLYRINKGPTTGVKMEARPRTIPAMPKKAPNTGITERMDKARTMVGRQLMAVNKTHQRGT